MKIPMPMQGLFSKSSSVDEPVNCTEYANNVRSVDVQENKLRIGQRPGQKKLNDDQLGGSAQPVVSLIIVSVVENTEG